MSDKIKITAGKPWIGKQSDISFTVFIDKPVCAQAHIWAMDSESAEGTARLYADAHEVFNTTGLTPTDLLHQRNSLLAPAKVLVSVNTLANLDAEKVVLRLGEAIVEIETSTGEGERGRTIHDTETRLEGALKLLATSVTASRLDDANGKIQELAQALDRTLTNFKGILGQRTMRDAGETIAEAENALANSGWTK